MACNQFIAWLEQLSRDEITRLARALGPSDTDGGDVAWWQATIALERSLRDQRRTAQSALAAQAAVGAIQRAAARAGLDPDAPSIAATARAAAEVARVLVAEDATAGVAYFVRRWGSLLPAQAWVPCARVAAA